MDKTPRSNRLHIGVYGRRNAGKSSLINFITGQDVALVSDTPGTTTDPVMKSMELLPLGPVVFIDTAGMDDFGELGELRVERTLETMKGADLALLVIPADVYESEKDISTELEWLSALRKHATSVLGLLSKSELLDKSDSESAAASLAEKTGIPFIAVSSREPGDRRLLLDAIVREAPVDFERAAIVGDLLRPGSTVMLVTPQDIQAPKGRLILPQVQTLRDLLDYRAVTVVSTLREFETALGSLREHPKLVITDSQVFPQVNAMLPRSVPLTSFSILMARYKGDLDTFVSGARKIQTLKESDRVLIAEACTHHDMEGDIARRKLPQWLRDKVGAELTVDVTSGHQFPDNLSEYSLIIHCGACMLTRKQLMSRLVQARAESIAVTNFGTAIAELNGILDRVTEIFTSDGGESSDEPANPTGR